MYLLMFPEETLTRNIKGISVRYTINKKPKVTQSVFLSVYLQEKLREILFVFSRKPQKDTC